MTTRQQKQDGVLEYLLGPFEPETWSESEQLNDLDEEWVEVYRPKRKLKSKNYTNPPRKAQITIDGEITTLSRKEDPQVKVRVTGRTKNKKVKGSLRVQTGVKRTKKTKEGSGVEKTEHRGRTVGGDVVITPQEDLEFLAGMDTTIGKGKWGVDTGKGWQGAGSWKEKPQRTYRLGAKKRFGNKGTTGSASITHSPNRDTTGMLGVSFPLYNKGGSVRGRKAKYSG